MLLWRISEGEIEPPRTQRTPRNRLALARGENHCHKDRRLPSTGATHVQLPRARLFRRAVHRQSASWQLSRRHRQIRRAAKDPRLPLLRRRSARHHRAAGPADAARQHARDRGGLHRLRDRPQEEHRLQPEPGSRTRRTRLGLELHRAHWLAEPHDAVQGQGRQGPRERLHRSLRLSRADGRRYSDLSRDACAGRRGPEAASGTRPRHRAKIQQRLRGVHCPAMVLARRSFRCPSR